MAGKAGSSHMDDPYLKESCRSFHKCQVANSARRNSLLKKSVVIEAERRLTTSQLDREEKQLREQLRQMKLDQGKASFAGGLREKQGKDSKGRQGRQPQPCIRLQTDCIDPYPVTFAGKPPSGLSRQRSMTAMEKAGRKYAASRGRRVSKEFEDLSLNTATGQLAIPSHLLRPGSRSPSAQSSGTPSPHLRRRHVSESHSSLESVDGSPWLGDPKAIQSVRRARKSVEEQDKERLHRVCVD